MVCQPAPHQAVLEACAGACRPPARGRGGPAAHERDGALRGRPAGSGGVRGAGPGGLHRGVAADLQALQHGPWLARAGRHHAGHVPRHPACGGVRFEEEAPLRVQRVRGVQAVGPHAGIPCCLGGGEGQQRDASGGPQRDVRGAQRAPDERGLARGAGGVQVDAQGGCAQEGFVEQHGRGAGLGRGGVAVLAPARASLLPRGPRLPDYRLVGPVLRCERQRDLACGLQGHCGSLFGRRVRGPGGEAGGGALPSRRGEV
mmetsp:Transcript_108330/g.345451  ORF Transcript_108330/g.345451 Transcript_108330/m.345451 type:complete len:258 (-) Transcript_108330:477-1250(-)